MLKKHKQNRAFIESVLPKAIKAFSHPGHKVEPYKPNVLSSSIEEINKRLGSTALNSLLAQIKAQKDNIELDTIIAIQTETEKALTNAETPKKIATATNMFSLDMALIEISKQLTNAKATILAKNRFQGKNVQTKKPIVPNSITPQTPAVPVQTNTAPQSNQHLVEPKTSEKTASGWKDTVKKWGNSISHFFSSEKKSAPKRNTMTGWKAIGLAAVMNIFGHKQAQQTPAPEHDHAPIATTVEHKNTQAQAHTGVDIDFSTIREGGSVRAGLSNKNDQEASVERGLEDFFIHKENGLNLLQTLYPSTGLNPTARTYLGNTIGNRIQIAINQQRAQGQLTGFHTRTNDETTSVTSLGRNANGSYTLEVSLTSPQGRIETATVMIKIPTLDQIDRYAALHNPAISHHTIAQTVKVANQAIETLERHAPQPNTDHLPPHFEQDLSGGPNTFDITPAPIHTANPLPEGVPQVARVPNIPETSSPLPVYPIQAVRNSPASPENRNESRNASYEETQRIAASLDLYGRNNIPAIIFTADWQNNQPVLTASITTGNNAVAITFSHLQIRDGQISCTLGDQSAPLGDAIASALTNLQLNIDGNLFKNVADRSTDNILHTATPEKQTIISSELQKLAESDQHKAAIEARKIEMQRQARANLDRYYQAREQTARNANRNQIRKLGNDRQSD